MSAETAYDLNNFTAKTEKEHDEEIRSRAFHLVKSRRQAKSIAPIKVVLCFVAVVAVCALMIYSQAVLTELTAEVNSYSGKMTVLNAEYTRLSGELETTTSIKTLEESAEKKLGLSKIDSSQVEYVNLTGADEISVAKTGGKYLIEEYWNNLIGTVKEYLPF